MAKKIKCPHCSTEFDLLPDMCGRRFACPVCGKPFAVSEAGDVVMERQTSFASKNVAISMSKAASSKIAAEELPKSSLGCLVFFLLILLLIGGGAYYWLCVRSKPQEVTQVEESKSVEMPQTSAEEKLRRALEEEAQEKRETFIEPTVGGVEGSREWVKSQFAWTPQRRETQFPLPVLDLQKAECVQRRLAVLESPNGAHFTAEDALSPVRQNAELIRAYTKNTLDDAPLAVRLANVRTHIFTVVGVDSLRSMAAREGGVEFLQDFFNDLEWMEEFASACPPFTITERRALRRLDMLVWNDDSNWIRTTTVGRRLATALALNGADSKREPIIKRFKIYERLYRTGRMHATAANYTVLQWREVLAPKLRVEDLIWLNNRAQVPINDLLALSNNVPRRAFNCFGFKQEDPYYTGLWTPIWSLAQTQEFTGSTPEGRLAYVAQLAQAQGIAASAIIPSSDLMEEGLLGKTPSEMAVSSLVFADTAAWLASERIRWLAATRARQFRAEGWSDVVDATYNAALTTCPFNILVWRDYRDWLVKNKVSPKIARAFARRAAKDLAPLPPFAYEMLNAWFAYLKRTGASHKVCLESLKEIHSFLREPDISWANSCGYTNFLANSASLLEGNSPALLELFDVIAATQLGTPNFFDQTLDWASNLFMQDSRASKKFLESIETWANPMTYTSYSAKHRKHLERAGTKPKPPQINWAQILYAASEAGNAHGFSAALDLAKRYAKEDFATLAQKKKLPYDKKVAHVPLSLFGARIVSENALPSATPLLRDVANNSPLTWDSFADSSPAGETSVCTASTNAPSITIALPNSVEVAGILVKNVEEEARKHTQQSPLVVEVSKDGLSWHKAWSETDAAFTTSRPIEPNEWRIDLSKHKPRLPARYIRVSRVPESAQAPFALAKVVVYGRKVRGTSH